MIHFTYITNPCQPTRGRKTARIKYKKPTINKIIKSQKVDMSLPVVCYLDGKPILRKHWNDKLLSNAYVAFVTLPLGGGKSGSNPLNVVLMVALVVLTVVTYGAASAAWGVYWGAAAAAAVSMGGSMLINAFVPPPKSTMNGMTSSLDSPSPTYSLQAQGNSARLGNPIPVIYGRHLIYPDFASQPYFKYIYNNQYLFQLHAIGQGEYDIEQIRIEDTPISSFEEITYQIIKPTEQITLFHEDVVSSNEVAGQELLKNNTVGPFVINPTETVINAIEIDIALQRGLYYANDNGTMDNLSLSWKIEARQIDDEGFAIGSWIELGTESITANSHNAIFKTYTYEVTNGRYEVRASRLDDKNTSSRAGHELRWASAKGFVVSEPNYSNVTLLAIKMKATDNLSQRSSRMINCIVTRKLPVWDGVSWTPSQRTQSIAWALADILKASYGANLLDKNIDLDGLLRLNNVWSARGDTFNAVFDSKLTIFEALSRTAKAGRTVPFIQSGIVRFVRDEQKSIPVALFGPRNILKNSLSIQYIMPSEDTADSVTVQYFSEKTWKASEIVGSLNEETSSKMATVELFGCTNKDQALREAKYMARSNRYRRRIVSFSTELEGLIPSYGDLITITHDMAKWGQGGEVIHQNGTVLTLSEPVTFTENQTHYIALRSKTGGLSGPYLVTKGSLETEVVLSDLPQIKIETGTSLERTHFAFGTSDKWAVMARVTDIKPRADKVDITAVIEDNRVHQEE